MERKITFILIGIVFWAIAAIYMHFVGPIVFDRGELHVAFWVINFFFPALCLPLIADMTGRTKYEMLCPTVLMAMPIMVLDSLAVTFDTLGWTCIYAKTPSLSAFTGGFLLFGAASFFFWAVYWQESQSSRRLK